MEWSDSQIQQKYRDDIGRVFELEDSSFYRLERQNFDEIIRERGVEAVISTFGPRWEDELKNGSPAMQLYKRCEVTFAGNHAKVLLPEMSGVDATFLDLFSESSVTWSEPSISAVVVAGEPRLQIDILLIDSWSDAREAEWQLSHPVYIPLWEEFIK